MKKKTKCFLSTAGAYCKILSDVPADTTVSSYMVPHETERPQGKTNYFYMQGK